jgi:DNA polymerase-1
MKTNILIIDGHNFMHRARAGFDKGDYSIVYTFFRNLRFLIEKQDPGQVYFVLEGYPNHRYELDPNYKANRVTKEGTPQHEVMKDFHAQKRIIIELLTKYFPIHVVKHPHYECDDTIYNLIKQQDNSITITVVSNDSDFIQLLNEFDNVNLYNPMKKCYVEKPNYNYVAWKSLVGDNSDNIKGFKGIGNKTALKLLENKDKYNELLSNEANLIKFNRNYNLIKFASWDKDDFDKLISTFKENINWDHLYNEFEYLGFQSIIKESTWKKFINTFNKLVI